MYEYLTYCVHLVGIKELMNLKGLINIKEFSGSPQGENVRLSLLT